MNTAFKPSGLCNLHMSCVRFDIGMLCPNRQIGCQSLDIKTRRMNALAVCIRDAESAAGGKNIISVVKRSPLNVDDVVAGADRHVRHADKLRVQEANSAVGDALFAHRPRPCVGGSQRLCTDPQMQVCAQRGWKCGGATRSVQSPGQPLRQAQGGRAVCTPPPISRQGFTTTLHRTNARSAHEAGSSRRTG